MSLQGNDRAAAIYKAIVAANSNVAQLSGAVDGGGIPTAAQVKQPDGTMGPSEKYKLLQGLQTLWGADTGYLQTNAEIAPGSLAAQQGIPVATTGSPAAQSGTTTAPGPLAATGRGKLL
jgi:hypothetical protein